MADIPKVKRNIQRMIDGGASEAEIDQYVASEGVSLDQLRAAPVPAKPDAGAVDAGIRGVAQGATFGLADEAAGVFGGVMDWMGLGPEGAKGTFGGGYDRTIAKARGMDVAAEENHPIASMGGEIAGALGTLPVTGALNIFRAPGVVARTAPMISRIGNAAARGAATVGNAAATGAAYGAAQGFGSAEGGAGNRLRGAAEGAALGGSIGGAIPVGGAVARGAARGAGNMMGIRGALSARSEAARRVVEAASRDARSTGQNLGDLAHRLDAARNVGVPMTALDLGEATRGLGRAAADVSPEGRTLLNQAVNDRYATQARRISDAVARNAPGINSPQTRDFLEKAARAANKPNYDRAMFEGEAGIWHDGLEQLTVAPAMKDAIRKATRTGANKAAAEGTRPPVNPFIKRPDGTLALKPGMRPTLRFWDHVKRNLDDEISRLDRAGEKSASADASALKRQLVSYLDDAAPSYRKARGVAAEFFGAQHASEAGQKFVRMGGDVSANAEARKAVQAMNGAERKLFAEGFATQLIADIQRIPDRASIVKRIFESPAARERFEIALGKKAADDMEMTLRVESILDIGREAVGGNSKTARYLTEIIGGGAAGAGVGMYATGANVLDPTTWIAALLGAGSLRGLRAAKGALNQRVMREIADLLASGNPQDFRDAIRRITQNPQLVSNVRRGHDRIVRALTPILPSGSSEVVPAFVDSGGSDPAQARQK